VNGPTKGTFCIHAHFSRVEGERNMKQQSTPLQLAYLDTTPIDLSETPIYLGAAFRLSQPTIER
jgi:hypothetical protein